MNGPIAHDALLSLALPSSSALRPSKSRRLTSLPSVAPTTRPAAAHGQHDLRLGVVPLRLRMDADLGAGADRGHRRPLGEDLGVRADADFEILRPDALRRSARPSAACASAEPGRTSCRLLPMTDRIDRRRPSAFAASPRACSSMTRSSRLATNVTPLALTACRSHGASSHGDALGRGASRREFASSSATRADARQRRRADGSPPADRRGSAVRSQVAATADRS